MLAREDNCEDHVGYKLDFFCQECEAAVCLVCVTRNHCDHKTIPNEKHSTTARAYLEDRLETLDTQEQTLSSHLQALENIAVKTRKEGEITIEEVKEKAKEIIEKVQQQERELIEEIQKKIEKSEESKKEVQCMLDQKKNEKRYIGQMIEKKIATRKTEKMKEMGIYAKDIIILDDIGDIYDSQMTFVMSEEYSRMLNAQFGTLATLAGKPEYEYDKKSGAKTKEYLSSKTFYSGLIKEKRSDLCYEKEMKDYEDERGVRCQKDIVKWKENILSLSDHQECQKAQVDDWKERGKGYMYEDCKDESVKCKEDILSSDHQECKKAQENYWIDVSPKKKKKAKKLMRKEKIGS
ncbi:tripartite motif-containing protein 2-like, partial [Actinia tenebrosa]|uniref:Tripartite motif-containing protein 2-like n=1 Tax=Actinia tenebrosa TaxID=6105 RepID=A0A6P8H6I5_ACTTE